MCHVIHFSMKNNNKTLNKKMKNIKIKMIVKKRVKTHLPQTNENNIQ